MCSGVSKMGEKGFCLSLDVSNNPLEGEGS